MINNANRLEIILDQVILGLVGFAAYSANSSTKSSWNKLYKRLKADNYKKKYNLIKKIKRLENSNIIILENNEYKLTKKGSKILKDLRIRNVVINKHKWDGVWHLVSYDIPNDNDKTRHMFANQLRKWGFKLVHKSLWILPWRCKNEILALAHSIGLEKYIIYMTTKTLPMEQRMKKHYKLP